MLALLVAGVAHGTSYNATFTRISTSGSPGAPLWRGWSAMTWVGSMGRIVMWGGSGADFLNDIVALDPASGGWTTIDPSNYCVGNTSFEPNGSDENGLVWDPLGGRLWLYNGGSGYRCGSPQRVGRTAGAGTTSTSIVDATLSPSVSYKDWIVRDPFGSRAHVTAYNATTRTLTLSMPLNVVPGGAYDLFVDFGDGTWSYNFASGMYSKLQQVHWGYGGYVPAPRKSPGFASDGIEAFLFGGVDWDNGLYRLDYATGAYTVAVAQGSASSPPARGQIQGHFVYDSVHDKFVLFGGRCFDPARCAYGSVLNDTWIYDPNTNQWTQALPAVRPPARNQAQMYFDAANGVVVLYGGSSSSVFNDLWTFDVATSTWTQQAMPGVNPGGVYLGQVAYAPTTQCGYIVYGLTSGATATGGTWKLCLTPAGGNQPPTASFTATPSNTTVGSPIALSAAASSDPDGSIVSYAWNFGDGTTGTGVSRSKSYSAPGTYTIALTVTDNAGTTGTTTRTVIVAAGNQLPVASFTATPSPATVGAAIAFSGAASSDPDGFIASYAWNFGDGTTGTGVSTSKSYSAAGTYTVTLSVTDNGGASASNTGTVTVTPSGGSSAVWMEDALPLRASAGGSEAFTWVTSSPTPYSGARAHQSAVASGIHQHYFTGATPKFAVAPGDRLFTYIYLDPANPPKQVMLQWYDGSWEHRAYWGASLIPWGGRSMGALPPVGQWVRLEVPASLVGLEGRLVDGVAFTLYDGRATWDYTGVAAAGGANQPPVASFTATPPATTAGSAISFSAAASTDPDGSIKSYAWNFGDGTTGSGVSVAKTYAAAGTYSVVLTVTDDDLARASTTRAVIITDAGSGTDTVWIEDDWPAGAAVTGAQDFTWITANPTPFSGARARQSALASGIHQHYFTGATTTLSVNAGDKLFAYVYLDPANPPKELMLQFNDGTWDHRAYWGANLIPWGSPWNGVDRRYVGPLPPTGQWVRLEVAASELGLEGRKLNGIAFTLYDGRAAWDRTGKTSGN
jgi:PKD repeat protein